MSQHSDAAVPGRKKPLQRLLIWTGAGNRQRPGSAARQNALRRKNQARLSDNVAFVPGCPLKAPDGRSQACGRWQSGTGRNGNCNHVELGRLDGQHASAWQNVRHTKRRARPDEERARGARHMESLAEYSARSGEKSAKRRGAPANPSTAQNAGEAQKKAMRTMTNRANVLKYCRQSRTTT